MAFRDPLAAYIASNNVEAYFVRSLLCDAGIEAVVIEGKSQAEILFGLYFAEDSTPQVWIERSDIERAQPVLTEYDRRKAERRQGKSKFAVDVVCENCGKVAAFSAAQAGTVQRCPFCREYIDVENERF